MEIKSIDRSTFDVVYDTYADEVHRIALYISGNHHIAEDITQTVFMTLYIHMDNVNVDKIENWLKSTAKHMTLNYVRNHKREKLVADMEEMLEDLDDSILYTECLEDWHIDKLSVKERSKFAQQIFVDLYQKNPRWYEALSITYILERPQKEVAETMGMPLGALQVMLFRAKNWIRKHYQKQLDHLDEI